MFQPRTRKLPVTAALAMAIAVQAFAQAGGQIAGKVRDASGGAVPGATITITDQKTGASRVVTSSADGGYAAADLQPGLYTVSAELKGFGKAMQKDLRVTADATATADFTMEAKLEEVITVTGTRVAGRTVTETIAPVDIIDSASIRSIGAVETGKILQLAEPSVNFPTTFVSDGTDIIRPATLRGLGADQTLVLVNGKRRHQTAHVNYQQTVARGQAGYDINTVPASAIERVEVLRDGAAAQYGSDAIAGVVNFILKRETRATDITLEAGQHYAENPALPLGASPDAAGGHGRSFMGAVNTGFDLGDSGFVNLTAEYRDRGETNRAGPDSIRVDPPRVTQRLGDPKAKDLLLWLNAGVLAGDGELYAFGGYSDRKGNSSGFFRSAGDNRTVPAFYPNGFLPTIITRPTDYSGNAGYRGVLGENKWRYDLSGSYGYSKFKFREENTVNVSYFYEPRDPSNPLGPRFEESPQQADTGNLIYDQFALNADFAGIVNWEVGAGPLNVALGAEWRREGYKIEPGEEVSYEYGRNNDLDAVILGQNGQLAPPGTQGFPGYSPREAVDESRHNFALYGDLESQLSKKLLVGLAGRFENYSDFGNTFNGKVSARVNLTDRFGLRGTFSTGFRAPSVQQLFYSSYSINLSGGVLVDTLTARQDSAVTRAFGVKPLKEETSLNYSLGLAAKPADNFRLTVDAYRVDIDDRIVFSSNTAPEGRATCGVPIDPTACPIRGILNQFGFPNVEQVLFFTNAIDTETKGLDIVALYDKRFDDGASLSLEGAFHINDTSVRQRRPSGIFSAAALFDRAQVTLTEEGQPRQHFVLSGTYRRSKWSGNVRANYFGKVAGEGFNPGFKQTWSGKWLTDASLTYNVQDNVSFTVGGLNIFDVYPDKWDPVLSGGLDRFGFVYGWETVPFGMNGGYYYARLNYRFNH